MKKLFVISAILVAFVFNTSGQIGEVIGYPLSAIKEYEPGGVESTVSGKKIYTYHTFDNEENKRVTNKCFFNEKNICFEVHIYPLDEIWRVLFFKSYNTNTDRYVKLADGEWSYIGFKDYFIKITLCVGADDKVYYKHFSNLI